MRFYARAVLSAMSSLMEPAVVLARAFETLQWYQPPRSPSPLSTPNSIIAERGAFTANKVSTSQSLSSERKTDQGSFLWPKLQHRSVDHGCGASSLGCGAWRRSGVPRYRMDHSWCVDEETRIVRMPFVGIPIACYGGDAQTECPLALVSRIPST